MKEDKKKRGWVITLLEIAEVTGQSLEVVRDHKQDGRLEPWDLQELSEYVVGIKLRKGKK